MGGDKSGGAVQSSTTKSEPWEPLQPRINEVLANAQTLYSQPYQAYAGQTVAGPADSTVAGYNLGYQRATLGAPDLNAARGSTTDISTGSYLGKSPVGTNAWLNRTATGQNLNSNPWLQNDYTNAVIGQNAQNMANAYATGAGASNAALAAQAGAFGGGLHQLKASADEAALANQVGQMANNYQLQRTGLGAQDYQNAQAQALSAANQQQGAYQSDMGNILNANALAGQLSQDDWRAADYLRSMGAQQEGYNQKLLDSQQSQWQQAMQAPFNQMQGYANLLSQFAGTGSTGSTQVYGGGPSPLGIAAGLGLTGAGLLNAYRGG